MSGRIANPDSQGEMLRRIRAALGARAGDPPPAAPLVDEELVRLVSPEAPLAALFSRRAADNGIRVHRCSAAQLRETLAGILRDEGACSVCTALPAGAVADAALGAAGDAGAAVIAARSRPGLGAAFEADAGITDAEAVIAETGSVVVRSDSERGRGVFVAPPVHIAVLPGAGAFPDLLDFLRTLRSPPTSLVLVSGPSKTADIEGILITGVHGPRAVHVVLTE